MEHRFEEQGREVTDTSELVELINRLQDDTHRLNQPVVSRSDKVTVEDVAEALDLDPEEVARVLKEIHEEHEYARVAGALRELEEPLYRVERPGHSANDSFANPLYKLRSIQMLTERVAKPTVLYRRTKEDIQHEKMGAAIGQGILVIFALVVICCAIYLMIRYNASLQ